MIHYGVIQGSPEWHQLRLGKVTASCIADVVARTKAGWGASRANYMARLIAERMTGVAQETYSNAAMEWGKEQEDSARAAYEFRTDCEVVQVGFIDHPNIGMCGASPDGLVGDDGLIEIKCPQTAGHIDTLLSQTIPDKYIKQMQWQLACSGRAWADFVSFDPRMPEHLRLFIKRINRDQKIIDELSGSVIEFLAELNDKVTALERLAKPKFETPILMAG